MQHENPQTLKVIGRPGQESIPLSEGPGAPRSIHRPGPAEGQDTEQQTQGQHTEQQTPNYKTKHMKNVNMEHIRTQMVMLHVKLQCNT